MTPLPAHYLTPEQYLEREVQSEFKHEYLEGQMIAMAGGTVLHSAVIDNLSLEIGKRLTGPCRGFNSDLRVSAHWEKLITYPDVTFGCPPFEIGPENTLLNPIVLGEVLSPSTSHHDRVTKAAYYRGIPSLRHYLLVEPERVEVVHGWRDEGFWKSETFTDLAAEIRLQGIEVTLPVAAIYAKTEGLS